MGKSLKILTYVLISCCLAFGLFEACGSSFGKVPSTRSVIPAIPVIAGHYHPVPGRSSSQRTPIIFPLHPDHTFRAYCSYHTQAIHVVPGDVILREIRCLFPEYSNSWFGRMRAYRDSLRNKQYRDSLVRKSDPSECSGAFRD